MTVEARDLRWEETRCDWCDTSEADLVFEGEDLLLNLPGRFQVVRCRKCGLFRQNPRLQWESLRRYYPSEYSVYDPVIDEEPSRWKRLDRRYGMWKRLRAIEHFQPGGRLLDVGCGTGIFMAEAHRRGRWEVFGLDPSATAAASIPRHLRDSFRQCSFAEAEWPGNSFDVITMWNVLEHLPHPIRDLRRAYDLLTEGGWLVFSVPNMESLEAALFGRYWLGWELPRHLYLFPRRELRAILQELHFIPAGLRCIAGSHAAFGLSLDFWLKKHTRRDSLRRGLLNLYRSLPVRVGLAPPFWLLARMRMCTLVTFFARKVSRHTS